MQWLLRITAVCGLRLCVHDRLRKNATQVSCAFFRIRSLMRGKPLQLIMVDVHT